MKGIGILTLAVTLFSLIVFNSPKLGQSNPLVDNSGCLECHEVSALHNCHDLMGGFSCENCHENVAGGGPVFTSKCIACHPLFSSGYCNLVDFHENSPVYNPAGASCLECHPDCGGGTTTTTTIIDGFCKGLADYDKDVDGTDAFVFKSHFGRSLLQNPCPPNGPAPVPKTGQIHCWAENGMEIVCAGSGQDGELQRGVAPPTPRFTDNEDGTVTDNLTGLIWLKNADCFGMREWNLALSDCHGLADGQCGLTDGSNAGDWRLSQIKELQSLIDFSASQPALPSEHPFTNVQFGYYWSSTTEASSSGYAWYVGMSDGYVSNFNKFASLYVWPVRGGH